jgi:hypothetical protein
MDLGDSFSEMKIPESSNTSEAHIEKPIVEVTSYVHPLLKKDQEYQKQLENCICSYCMKEIGQQIRYFFLLSMNLLSFFFIF